MDRNLLSSSLTLASLQISITAFYCGSEKAIVRESETVWSIWNIRDTGNIRLEGVRIVKKGKRFRFEMFDVAERERV